MIKKLNVHRRIANLRKTGRPSNLTAKRQSYLVKHDIVNHYAKSEEAFPLFLRLQCNVHNICIPLKECVHASVLRKKKNSSKLFSYEQLNIKQGLQLCKKYLSLMFGAEPTQLMSQPTPYQLPNRITSFNGAVYLPLVLRSMPI